MQQQHQRERRGYLLLVALGATVLAFMGLSLAITATGTARFVVVMGYPPELGYAVGAIFDIAKALLPVALLVFVTRRAFLSFAIIGTAWIGLVTYSWLATHATVSSAIAAVERNGTWKMESRTNAKSELNALEQQLAILSHPLPPRPSRSVAEALISERVPPRVWRDSQECASIRKSRYFANACAKVLKLRQELAAAQDYEKLETRAEDLRQTLATEPIVSTQDPLPKSFAATIGRLVPLEGDVGVASLLTLVVEIMSCFGLAALNALRLPSARLQPDHRAAVLLPEAAGDDAIGAVSKDSAVTNKLFPERPETVLPNSSLTPGTLEAATAGGETSKPRTTASSNVLPLPTRATQTKGGRGASMKPAPASGAVFRFLGAHVPSFAADNLAQAPGASLAAADIRSAYEAWCAANGNEPLSQQKLSAELLRLGYSKWKSCGLIRYRDVRLVA